MEKSINSLLDNLKNHKRFFVFGVSGLLVILVAAGGIYYLSVIKTRNDLARATELAKQGKDLVGTAKYKEAVPVCKEAINLDSKNKEAYLCLMRSYDLLKSSETEATAKKFIELYPQEPLGYSILGTSYEIQARFKDAEDLAKKAIGLFPKGAMGYTRLGHVYDREGHLDLAIVNYKIAVELDPKFGYAHEQMGRAYTQKGNYPEAKKAYELANKNSPEHSYVKAESLLNLGFIAYQADNNVGLAIQYLEESIKTVPDLPVPYINLARHYYRAGRVAEAIELDKKAMTLDDKLTRPYLDLAEIYLREGKSVDEATGLLENAQKRLSSDHTIPVTNRERPANINYFLAAAYAKKNNFDKAFEFLARAFRYDKETLLGELTPMVKINKDVRKNALTDPLFTELRKDARFSQLVTSKAGLVPQIGL